MRTYDYTARVTLAPSRQTIAARPRLRTNMLWTAAGNVTYAACQWGMLAGIAKLGRPENVGDFALAMAIGAPVYMLTNLQLRSVQATDSKSLFRFSDYLWLRYLCTGLALLIIAGLAIVGRFTSEVNGVVLLVALAKAFEAVADVYYGALQQRERLDIISVSLVIRGFASLLCLNGILILTGNLLFACAGLALSWFAVLVFYDIPRTSALVSSHDCNHAAIRRLPAPDDLLRLVKVAAPLGVSMMLASLAINLPRYFVEGALGPRSLGIFAALAYVMVAGTTVINAIGQSATPRLGALFANGMRTQFLALLSKLVACCLALAALGMLAAAMSGKQMLTLLYRPEYAARLDVFLWLTAATGIGFVGNILGFALTAARMFTQGALCWLLITLITYAGCAILIPRYGLRGAAWSTLLTSVAMCVTQGGLLVHQWRRQAIEARGGGQ